MAHNGNIIRAAILASGNGTNAENIIRHAAAYPDRIQIAAVITNKKDAHVIERARQCGVSVMIIPRDTTKAAQESDIIKALHDHRIDWVFLAGFMQILSADFISAFRNKIINIHPSLLPQFPGRDAYADAFNANVPVSGVTLHYVDEGVDTGPVIAQKAFPRLPADTLETFRARGMELEYEIYREFIDHLVRSAAA